ncbi:MAG: TonB family protein [Candidatus Eisenbacteria bacterium]|nr:TonB family protein [Candidatus Eisenbacteria bacterium]
MKKGFVISLSVHLGLLAVIFGPLTGRATILSPGTIYEVSLVSLPAGFPGPQDPPAGSNEPPDATLATPEPGEVTKEALKLPAEKKSLEKKAIAEKKKEAPDTKSASSHSANAERKSPDASKSGLHSLVKGGVGPGGGSGAGGYYSQLQLDIENFEFSYYLVAVRNKVSSSWNPPAGLSTAASAVRTVVFFRIERNGRIADLKIETPSGIPFFDQSALRAVLRSEPFPSLPRGFADSSLGVHFGFEYVQ